MQVKVFCGAFVLLMLNVALSFAQGLPCGGTDPDAVCPLDTWVMVLAAIVFVFAAVRLHRKQRPSIR